jgi:hypothetical protein
LMLRILRKMAAGYGKVLPRPEKRDFPRPKLGARMQMAI